MPNDLREKSQEWLKWRPSNWKWPKSHRKSITIKSAATSRSKKVIWSCLIQSDIRWSMQQITCKRRKLSGHHKGLDLFYIEHMISDNVAMLILPKSMKSLNPTFNIDVLSHYVENLSKFLSRVIPKASRVIIHGETGSELHFVEKLLKRRQFIVNRSSSSIGMICLTMKPRGSSNARSRTLLIGMFFLTTSIGANAKSSPGGC